MRSNDSLGGVPRSDPPSADEAVARLRLEWRHLTLGELVADGVLEWDSDAQIVRRGPEFDGAYADVDAE